MILDQKNDGSSYVSWGTIEYICNGCLLFSMIRETLPAAAAKLRNGCTMQIRLMQIRLQIGPLAASGLRGYAVHHAMPSTQGTPVAPLGESHRNTVPLTHGVAAINAINQHLTSGPMIFHHHLGMAAIKTCYD